MVVTHPVDGDTSDAEALAESIRREVNAAVASGSKAAVFHDMSGMESASPGYGAVFRKLQDEIREDVVEVRAATERPGLRVMARTVSVGSPVPWQIHKTREEALEALATNGYRA